MTTDAPSYALPLAAPIAEPRTFPLRCTDRGVRDLSMAEADYRAGVVRHEFNELEAAYRGALLVQDWPEADRLDRRLRTLRLALVTLETQRRYGYGPRGGEGR